MCEVQALLLPQELMLLATKFCQSDACCQMIISKWGHFYKTRCFGSWLVQSILVWFWRFTPRSAHAMLRDCALESMAYARRSIYFSKNNTTETCKVSPEETPRLLKQYSLDTNNNWDWPYDTEPHLVKTRCSISKSVDLGLLSSQGTWLLQLSSGSQTPLYTKVF